MTGSPEQAWCAALAEGRILLQRARASGEHFFPPRLAEPRSGDSEWDWVEARGIGTVYSVTVISPRPPTDPYNVALIDLDEGPRMMSRVEGLPPDGVAIGLRVRARIAESEGEPLILFDPA